MEVEFKSKDEVDKHLAKLDFRFNYPQIKKKIEESLDSFKNRKIYFARCTHVTGNRGVQKKHVLNKMSIKEYFIAKSPRRCLYWCFSEWASKIPFFCPKCGHAMFVKNWSIEKFKNLESDFVKENEGVTIRHKTKSNKGL